MTQKQYDEQQEKMARIRDQLTHTRITPEEALDGLLMLGFGFTKAVALVDKWGAKVYAPYAVWSKIKA